MQSTKNVQKIIVGVRAIALITELGGMALNDGDKGQVWLVDEGGVV